MRKVISILSIFTASLLEATAQNKDTNEVFALENPLTLLYIALGFTIMVSLLVLIVAFYVLRVLVQVKKDMLVESTTAQQDVTLTEQPGFWSKINQQLSDSVPIEAEETILLDHEYDGIRELDNHLPPWWKGLLYGSIVWAAGYLFVYHVMGSLPLSIEEYTNEVAYAEAQIMNYKKADTGPQIDENTVVFTEDETALGEGQQIFDNLCASCHRVDGGGDIGPNLTDAYWIHGGTIQDVFKVVSIGVQGTNMISWSSSLSPAKIQNVSSYLLTLQGTNPSNPKSPEGDLYQPDK